MSIGVEYPPPIITNEAVADVEFNALDYKDDTATLTQIQSDARYVNINGDETVNNTKTFTGTLASNIITNSGSITSTGNITAGKLGQTDDSVAIGRGAGQTNQGNNATAVGDGAGGSNQGNNATAVGVGAGGSNQTASTTAIGHNANFTGAISAIPAGAVLLNGSGTSFPNYTDGQYTSPGAVNSQTGGLYVRNIRVFGSSYQPTNGNFYQLYWSQDSGEIYAIP